MGSDKTLNAPNTSETASAHKSQQNIQTRPIQIDGKIGNSQLNLLPTHIPQKNTEAANKPRQKQIQTYPPEPTKFKNSEYVFAKKLAIPGPNSTIDKITTVAMKMKIPTLAIVCAHETAT